MNKFIKLGIFTLAVLVMQACTSAHLKPVANPSQMMKPQSGKALVIFMRPSSFGGAIQSTVFDGETYISTVSANTRVAYQAEPGEHMFMVIGESADFMKATLNSNKTYYALVAPRVGFWKARFSLKPIRKDHDPAELTDWLESTTLMEPNAEGFAWAKENAADISNKRDEYLPQWKSKSAAAQNEQTLLPEDGR